MSYSCHSKNEVAFKITTSLIYNRLLLNFDQIVILKATLVLEGYERNMGMTSRIT
jgi:hypothetical protein